MLYENMLIPLVHLLTHRDAERAHEWAIRFLHWLQNHQDIASLMEFHYSIVDQKLHRTVAGIDFPNPVGLAPGFDKHGQVIPAWFALGFGFGTVGTVLPKPQPGHPRPRIFRAMRTHTIINRMGFNSAGMESVSRNFDACKTTPYGSQGTYRAMPIGISLSKQLDTTLPEAGRDMAKVMDRFYTRAAFFEANPASPNTPGLRQLQEPRALERLLIELQQENQRLAGVHKFSRRPLFVKVDPDLEPRELAAALEVIGQYADGVIGVNTTRDHSRLRHPIACQQGGMSGPLLKQKRRAFEDLARKKLGNDFPVISVGGIDCEDEALRAFDRANLIQLYTAAVFQGPSLVRDINRALIER